MFLGTYEPKLDDKGRVILPAKFRADMEGGVVLTKGQERCIYAFPMGTFKNMASDMLKAPLSAKQVRDWTRVMLAAANDQYLDKQGRIHIPQELRAYAGLDKELVVIGVGDRAEIWNMQAWKQYLADQEDAFSQTETEIFPGMF